MQDKQGDVSLRPSLLAGEGADEGTVTRMTPSPPPSPTLGRGSSMTPLMQQYRDLKARYPGEILFFRLGDFYELFGEEAKHCAPLLDVALTHRQDVPMCGVPAHSVEPYI